MSEIAGSYADPELPTSANSTREWSHGLGEVVARIIDAGLTIELVAEHRCAPWRALPCCERGTDGNWRLPENLRERLPLLFSLRARKPEV